MSIQDKLAAKYIEDTGVLGDMAKAHVRNIAAGDIQRIEAAGLRVIDAADADLAEHYKNAAIRQNSAIMDAISEAMPERFPNDPEYGYVTGDHVAESMVDVLISEYQRLAVNNVVSWAKLQNLRVIAPGGDHYDEWRNVTVQYEVDSDGQTLVLTLWDDFAGAEDGGPVDPAKSDLPLRDDDPVHQATEMESGADCAECGNYVPSATDREWHHGSCSLYVERG